MAVHRATTLLHLFTSPKTPDVFVGMADATDPEPAEVFYTPLAQSRRNHPSNTDAQAAS